MNLGSIRTRMVASVAAIFGVTTIVAGLVMVNRLEQAMISNAQESATALVSDYVLGLSSGSLVADEEPQFTTRLVFLDEDGEEISSEEFGFLVISSAPIVRDADGVLIRDFGEDFELFETSDILGPVIIDSFGNQVPGAEFLDSDGITFELAPIEVGEIVVEESEDFVTASAGVRVGDQAMSVGAEQTLLETRQSMAALKRLLVLGIPMLTLFVAGIAWLVVGGALRPVTAMAARVQEISNDSLDQRVPEPASTDELAHLANTMNAMLSRLQNARDSQRQFISDASHELRSPITATKATIEVARAHPDATDWVETAKVLAVENDRLADLVDDLLLLAHLEESTTAIAFSGVDLDEICLAEAQRPHPVDVTVRVICPARVNANLGRLTRAVRNIVENGTRHADNAVEVKVWSSGGFGVIEITDDGKGIDPEMLETIFDRFTRVGESRNRADGGGAGLGLAIARQIVESANGTIEASNRDGAVFTIRLPLA